jgi:hypothetical protein
MEAPRGMRPSRCTKGGPTRGDAMPTDDAGAGLPCPYVELCMTDSGRCTSDGLIRVFGAQTPFTQSKRPRQ